MEFLIVVLAAYRLTRLGGWDEFPLAERVREWVIGQYEVPASPGFDADDLGLPGKQPHSLVDGTRPAYRRQTLAHLIHCPFCLGWWVSLAVYLAWLAAGTYALYVFVPFAISGAVGVISKNLDA